jgi:hypothetical protein
VDVAEHIGVSFENPVWKPQELFNTDYVLLSDAMNEAKVREDASFPGIIIILN